MSRPSERRGADNAISVIIPVHNGAGTLAKQLCALTRQIDAPAFEVVVVLNQCSDRSRAVSEQFHDPLDLVLVDANDRSSCAHARNVGASTATGGRLLFCDADDVVGCRWVAAMSAALDEDGVGIVGGRILVDRRGLADWIYDLRYHAIDGSCLHRSGDVLFAVGASLGCLRSAFDDVDGFDESFQEIGGEEVDFAARVQRAGYRIGEAVDADVRYRPRATLRTVLTQACSYERGAVVLAAKEGRLHNPCPNRRALVTRATRRLGHLVLREGERHPCVLLVRAATTIVRLSQERRLTQLT